MSDSQDTFAGHRDRLRTRFDTDAASLNELELLELLLTYAIPRRDVGPIAKSLLERFGTLECVVHAHRQELEETDGIGKHASRFLHLIAYVLQGNAPEVELTTRSDPATSQLESKQLDRPQLAIDEDVKEERPLRAFVNDETANSLLFVPQAPQFNDVEDFRAYLNDHLPYNSATTRQRRASHIIDRFYADGRIDTPLTYFVARCSNEDSLRDVLFYHVLKAEPLGAAMAEGLIWPALAFGTVDREEMREFVLRHLPVLSQSSQANTLRSLMNAYNLFDVAEREGKALRFRLHTGTLDAFVYVLSAEFPEPGMYTFQMLEQGPVHKWLLWDRQWMRRQLYNLRDLGIVAKVSEIDNFRQFSLAHDRITALRRYFEAGERNQLLLREQSNPTNTA